MAEALERAEERLDTIQSVEPILSALRTISHGSWQNSRRKLREIRQYLRRLSDLIAYVPLHIRPPSPGLEITDLDVTRSIIVLLVGSERGLCGRFHIDLADHFHSYLQRKQAQGFHIELWVLGSRMKRRIEQRGYSLAWFQRTSLSGIPDSSQAFEWLRELLWQYESGGVESIYLLHHSAKGGGPVQPQTVRLIPPSLPQRKVEPSHLPWPPPIIDTDPYTLYERLLEQQLAAKFLQSLLESAVAEHSTRFHLMEGATKNAERLIEELSNQVQLSRRQAITQQMEELVVGSGMLEPDR